MRWLTFDLRTGRKLRYLPTKTGGDWKRAINDPGSLSCTVPMTVDTAKLNLRESTRPVRTGLACLDGDRVLNAGPVWSRRYSREDRSLELRAAGIGSYFDHRVVMRVLWEAAVVSGEINTDDPNWVLTFTGESFSNMVKGLISEAMDWTGGDLPIILPADTPGTRDQSYQGYDLATVWQRVKELTEREGGPEVRFDPQLTSDRQGVEFVLKVGTEANPELAAERELKVNAAAKDSPVSGLEYTDDGTGMGSMGWALGGRQNDTTVMVKQYDSFLIDRDYPLMDLVDKSHPNAFLPATLNGYLGESLARARKGRESWTFRLRRDRPLVGSYREGDHVALKVARDPFIPDGTYSLKIIGLGGTDGSDWVDVTLAERVA